MEVHRAVRWQNELDALLASKRVTPAQAKRVLRRYDVEAHLASKAAQM